MGVRSFQVPPEATIKQLSILLKRCVHFVGFRGDEYWSAVKVFGEPDYIHRGWDLRAQREIADGDMVMLAQGEYDQEPRTQSYDDIREKFL